MKYGVDRDLEAAADEFLRAHGEEPPKLGGFERELAAWQERVERELGR